MTTLDPVLDAEAYLDAQDIEYERLIAGACCRECLNFLDFGECLGMDMPVGVCLAEIDLQADAVAAAARNGCSVLCIIVDRAIRMYEDTPSDMECGAYE